MGRKVRPESKGKKAREVTPENAVFLQLVVLIIHDLKLLM
jgi:hypothetical protein